MIEFNAKRAAELRGETVDRKYPCILAEVERAIKNQANDGHSHLVYPFSIATPIMDKVSKALEQAGYCCRIQDNSMRVVW